MKGIPRGRYTKEFREEAVKLVTDEKLSRAEAARKLSIPVFTIENWARAYKFGKLGELVFISAFIKELYRNIIKNWSCSKFQPSYHIARIKDDV